MLGGGRACPGPVLEALQILNGKALGFVHLNVFAFPEEKLRTGAVSGFV